MRWLIRFVAALVGLAALAVAALFLLPADRIAGLAAEQIRSATGRELTLSGRLRPSVWPDIGVATGPVTLSNSEWSDEGPMLQAKGLSVGLDLMALIGGDIVIREITAQAPRIVLEKAADGRVNWAMGAAGGDAAPDTAQPGGARAFSLENGRISDARVLYIDHATGRRIQLSGLDAALSLPDYQGAATLSLSGDLNGQPLRAEAGIGGFAALLTGAVTPVTLRATLGATRAAFEGRAGLTPLAAEGALEAEVTDLPALFAVLGQPAPDLPPGVGQRMGLEGRITHTPEGTLHLRDATLRQDANLLRGDADLVLLDRPRLTGRFSAGTLDLAPFIAGDAAGGDAGRAGGPQGWSRAPIDVSALGALDAEVTLSADLIALGKGQLGPAQIKATLTDRRLVVDLQKLQAYGGTIIGAVVVNGRGALSVRGDLTATGVAMQALLRDLAGYERLVGQGDLRLSVLGSGASMAAIMDSLGGQGDVSFGKGEILGLDIVGMLRTLDLSYMGKGAKTIFDAITASFTIEQGVLRNDDLAFVAPLLRASGQGRVGLGAQTLEYRLLPTALGESDGSGGVKVPLLITGPWADPRFRLDLEAAAREKLDLDARKQELEQKAKDKAAQELGLRADEGESLEDAARRKLEEEAKRGLKNLFNLQ